MPPPEGVGGAWPSCEAAGATLYVFILGATLTMGSCPSAYTLSSPSRSLTLRDFTYDLGGLCAAIQETLHGFYELLLCAVVGQHAQLDSIRSIATAIVPMRLQLLLVRLG